VREADHSPSYSAEVKNSGDIPPLPQYVFTATTLPLPYQFRGLLLPEDGDRVVSETLLKKQDD
jgi:hypothetical protein